MREDGARAHLQIRVEVFPKGQPCVRSAALGWKLSRGQRAPTVGPPGTVRRSGLRETAALSPGEKTSWMIVCDEPHPAAVELEHVGTGPTSTRSPCIRR